MKLCSTLFVFFLMFATPVSATNFFVGLNLGAMDQSGEFTILDSTLDPGVGLDEVKDYQAPDDVTGTGSFFMGYKLGKDLFLEVGYGVNAELEADPRFLDSGEGAIEKTESTYHYAAFVGLWPIQSSWALSARLGFSIWDLKYTQTVIDPSVLATDPGYIIREEKLTDNTSAMLLGVGMRYGFSENLEFKLTVENHFVDFSFTNVELDMDALSVTLGTSFYF